MHQLARRMPLAIWCSAPQARFQWLVWPVQLRLQLVLIAIVLACLTLGFVSRGGDAMRRFSSHRHEFEPLPLPLQPVAEPMCGDQPCALKAAAAAPMQQEGRTSESTERDPASKACVVVDTPAAVREGHSVCKLDGASGWRNDDVPVPVEEGTYIFDDEHAAAHPCRWLDIATPRGNVSICAYPAGEDPCVTEALARDGVYHAFETAKIAAVCAAAAEQGTRGVMLDVGSQLGVFALTAAHAGCDVITVDPLIEHASRVHRSLTRLRDAQVAAGESHPVTFTVLRAAAMHVSTRVNITRHPGRPAVSFIKHPLGRIWPLDSAYPDGMSQRVPALRLDDVLASQRDRIIAIKLDAENYDVPALVGMSHVLAESSVRVVVLDFVPRQAVEVAGCDAEQFVRWMGTHLRFDTEDPATHAPWSVDAHAAYVRDAMLPHTAARHVIYERAALCK